VLTSFCAFALWTGTSRGTSNHEYGADEYDTIESGISPDARYAITAHGGGDLGYDHFHIYLTNAVTGDKIGPLEEIKDILDTGADAYAAKWSADSTQVAIVYRVDRHAPLKAMVYRVAKGRAFPIKGPVNLGDDDPLVSYWQQECSNAQPSPRVFRQTGIATIPWPKKIMDFPAKINTVEVKGFKITVRDSKDQSEGGTGGGMVDIIVQNLKTGEKLSESEQSLGIRILEFFKGWPQFEIWSRAGAGAWCRYLYRFTGKDYDYVRVDDFTESESGAKDKTRTTTLPGDDGLLYFVETRVP
jgi:hypothetical protein